MESVGNNGKCQKTTENVGNVGIGTGGNMVHDITTELGQLTRKFRDTTQSAFATVELPKETEARKCWM